ncbi:hypothetical protein KAR91_62170, partial [Candidatus Pacearchaeota archaeon]|nr:hypothetical protein [Candidatus Pacearchaeota archaeon]
KFDPPTMEDFYEILDGMEGTQELAQRLQKYTKGTFSGIFNKPTNIDLQKGLMVFCIRDLEDQLRPTAIYIILNYIWNRVRSSLKRRMLVIDEAWSLVQYEDSARFLYGLVKRARKYYLGITTITQDVTDFIKSDYGRPIITNSSMQLLLKQAPSSIEGLTKIFNLTEGEKYLLLNSTVGQGLFFAGLKHVALQVIASYAEDKVVTTNPEELMKQQAQAAPPPAEASIEESAETDLGPAGDALPPIEEVAEEQVISEPPVENSTPAESSEPVDVAEPPEEDPDLRPGGNTLPQA